METNTEQILLDIGLSKNEAKAYLALFELGSATVTQISKKSKVHRTNLYDALERLKKKGLVSTLTKEKKVLFEATDPSVFSNLLKEKETKLATVMAQLELAKKISTNQSNVEIREGLAGVKSAYADTLKQGKPIYTFGSPKAASDLARAFLNQFHKERIARKIPMYHIYNADAQQRINEIKKWPFTFVRTLAPEYNSPISTGICGDEVALKIWDEKEGMAIIIRDARIAKAYMNYFNLLWKMAKQVK